MSKYWRSSRTGRLYDVTDRDRYGNFREISEMNGAVPALLAGAAVTGTVAVSTAIFMGIMALVPFMILIALCRWPPVGLVLLVLSIVMLWVPAGRAMRPWIYGAIGLSVLHLPLSVLSLYMSGQHEMSWYFVLGALPLVPVAALICAIVALVKRMWGTAVLTIGITAASGFLSLAIWVSVLMAPSAASAMNPQNLVYDSIPGIVCFLVLGVCWVVIMRQKASR